MVDVLFEEGRFDPHNLLSFSSPMLTEVGRILTIEDANTQDRLLRELTAARLAELQPDATDKFLGEGIEEGFIGSRDVIIEMMTFFFSGRSGLRLDDYKVYPNLLKLMGTLKKGALANNSLAAIAPIAVHGMGIKYFGGYEGTFEEIEEKRETIYGQTGKPSISIDEFKEKGIAVCAERAPLAHNMLVFLGYRSLLVYSDEFLIEGEDDWSQKHVFNIFLTDNSRILFEPTNFARVRNDEGNVIGSFPALSPISTEELESLKCGEKLKIVHNDLLLSNRGFYPTNPEVRIYQGPTI